MKRLFCLMLALLMVFTLAACGGGEEETTAPSGEGSAIPGLEDVVLTVGMECVYAPYNWTQMDDSNCAVPIVNQPGAYANGYDVMMAKKFCEQYGWEL